MPNVVVTSYVRLFSTFICRFILKATTKCQNDVCTVLGGCILHVLPDLPLLCISVHLYIVMAVAPFAAGPTISRTHGRHIGRQL